MAIEKKVMEKMTFNLINRFILWLKKILHIRPVKVTPQSEEKTGEVSHEDEKPAEMPLLEKKTTEGTLVSEQRPPEILSEKEPQKQYREKIPITESQTKPIIEEDKTEEKDTLKLQRPYKKKAPTEERKPIKQPTIEKKPSSPEQKKTIYLGNIQKIRRRLIEAQRKSPSDENIGNESIDKISEKKELATIVEAPFVEIDIDEAKVYLILPKQQFKANMENELSRYTIEVNGEQQEFLAKTTTDREGCVFVEEKRILLENPLLEFQVAFPGEIQGRKYNYNHDDKGLYTFVTIGNNRGRMFYLYDEEGDVNLLPKKNIWILLNEDFELQTEPDVIEERWIWGKYQPFRIDLSKIDALVIKNRISGEENSFTLQSTFWAEGEQLIEDDYKKECPLFAGKTLKIVAPYENQSGWRVWIQNKVAGYKIRENWTGRERLTLRLPDDLPCEFGEFQIDICQQDTRIPDDTLFFRLMSCIELNYPKEIIIPHPELGHTPSTISVKLDNVDEWELKYKESIEFKLTRRNNIYEIELPADEDTLRFSIVKTTRPESTCNFRITLPRLKWKTSKQKIWNSRLQEIERKDLKSGEPFYLRIQTNDCDNKYDLLALLETKGQKLQEGKFIRKGLEYSLELNQFYNTIKQNMDELILRVEIQSDKHNYWNEICILKFKPPIIRCKYISCSFETCRTEEMWSHFEKNHFHNLIEHLTYEELKEYDELLPHRIYKCAYCDFYSREDDPRNPTSLICAHIDNRCPQVRRGKGPPRVAFSVVFDINEIRQNVLPNLLEIYKCKLCSIHLKDNSQKAQIEHFFTEHGNEIYEYL